MAHEFLKDVSAAAETALVCTVCDQPIREYATVDYEHIQPDGQLSRIEWAVKAESRACWGNAKPKHVTASLDGGARLEKVPDGNSFEGRSATHFYSQVYPELCHTHSDYMKFAGEYAKWFLAEGSK